MASVSDGSEVLCVVFGVGVGRSEATPLDSSMTRPSKVVNGVAGYLGFRVSRARRSKGAERAGAVGVGVVAGDADGDTDAVPVGDSARTDTGGITRSATTAWMREAGAARAARRETRETRERGRTEMRERRIPASWMSRRRWGVFVYLSIYLLSTTGCGWEVAGFVS